nr:hypothetical protein Iba_chr13fCG11980 [Ipomoea batatas]
MKPFSTGEAANPGLQIWSLAFRAEGHLGCAYWLGHQAMPANRQNNWQAVMIWLSVFLSFWATDLGHLGGSDPYLGGAIRHLPGYRSHGGVGFPLPGRNTDLSLNRRVSFKVLAEKLKF